ncbi:hypothetical protein HPY86_03215 [candidate division WOR-3 bacterium]|nr:hypothetical protein [candidate division WOR-3 bacterium]
MKLPIMDFVRSSIALFSFSLILLVITGCRRLDPNYSEPMVNGYLYRGEYYDYSVEYERYVQVFDPKGLRMVPIVTLNEERLDVLSYNWTRYEYGDTLEFDVSRPYELRVVHYWGNAQARVTMPGNFSLTSPPERYILDLDSTLVISWTRSEGAEWYWVELDVSYEYRDTLGTENDYDLRLDTMVQDTYLIVSPERIFPGFVADVIEGDGSAMVWSGCGPAIEPGDRGNVQGVGFGFFNAINEPREKYFYVGAPIQVRRCPDRRTATGQFLEKLRNRIMAH